MFSSRIKTNLFTALAWLLVCFGARSQTVVIQLKNGDRLTGTIVSENTNRVVLSTSWARDLAIPWSEISKREQIAPAPEAAKPAAATATNVVSTVTPVTPALPPVSAKKKPAIMQAKSWHGKIDVGMDLGFSERNRQLYYGNAKVIYAPEVLPDEIRTFASRFKNTFDYNATYGKTEGVLSANKMDGVSKTDVDIGKRLFIYNFVAVGYDQIRAIDFQYEIGPGVGYHLITRSNLVLNTEFGGNYQVQNFQNNVQNNRFFLRLAEDLTWTITPRLTLDEKLEVMPSIDTFRSFRLRFESNLRYKLWQNISLALSVLDLYDTKPAPGIGKNDLQVRSMLGISF